MEYAQVNGLSLAYETFGCPEQPAVLLIMGLGAQLTLWPESFCRALAEAGHYVIRYDNRDVGFSSKLDTLGRPRLLRASLSFKLGLPVRAGYTLDDMAGDALGLLDALGIRSAHVIGASMGGMIAQLLAARYPQRVSRLVLMMTSAGGRRAPGPRVNIALRLLRRPASQQREALIAHSVETWKRVGSPAFRPSTEAMHAFVAEQYDRAHDPAGVARQMLAILASEGRGALLGRIVAPTLVLHGRIDPLVPLAAGRALAGRIPGARLDVIDAMGHDLPAALVPRLTAAVLSHLSGVAGPTPPRSGRAMPRRSGFGLPGRRQVGETPHRPAALH